MTPLCGPPALVHSVLLASSAKTRWCVGKHVLISVNLPVFGSYIERWRLADSIGNSFADGWSEPFLQKSGIGRRAHARGEPHAPLLVEHRVVHAGLAVPDRLVAPVRRGRHRVLLRRRRVRIAHRASSPASPCGSPGRAPGRGRCSPRARRRCRPLALTRRVALVGRDLVVQVVLGPGPVPQREDDVALDALRPRRLRRRQLAGGDAVGPVGEELQRARRLEPAEVR